MSDQLELDIGTRPNATSLTASKRPRQFIPANREDVLVFLASLAVSRAHADSQIALPLLDGKPALVEKGLRSSEEILLAAGRNERFPLLLEILDCLSSEEKRCIPYTKFLGLRFRSESEAEAFRLRPIEEYDTEELPWSVEPELFSRPGEARFKVYYHDEKAVDSEVRIAERLASSLRCLIDLGEREPELRYMVMAVLNLPPSRSQGTPLTWQAAMAILLGFCPNEEASSLASLLCRVFAAASNSSPRELVDSIVGNFTDLVALGLKEKTVQNWVDYAEAVLQNRVTLDGEYLSDQREILLRAALLAIFVDEIESLVTFIHAEKPAGRMVTSIAALFIGLRKGLLDSSWASKKQMVHTIAPILPRITALFSVSDFSLIDSLLNGSAGSDEKQSIRLETLLALTWVKATAAFVSDSFPDPEVASIFQRKGFQVLSAGSMKGTIRIRWSNTLELEASLERHARMRWIRLHYVDTVKHRPAQSNSRPPPEKAASGFWRRDRIAGGIPCYTCDLIDLPGKRGAALIEACLQVLLGSSAAIAP